MTDNSSPSPESSSSQTPQPPRRRAWRTSFLVAGAFAAGLVGGLATTGFSDAARFGPGFGWHEGGPGRAIMGAHMSRMGGWRGAATAEERAERMVGHVAARIDATDEQRERLIAIARGAAEELQPLRERLQAAGQEARTLLTAETIDRDAMETFRAEQVALVDTAARRLAEALGEAAEVLTPEQRTELSSLMERFGERRGGRHHR
jgi:periplasmic protein CpxP/Spy